MTGPERNATKNRAIRVAPSMVSAKMVPAYAAKDGTEDIAHYVRKTGDYVFAINSVLYSGIYIYIYILPSVISSPIRSGAISFFNNRLVDCNY